MIRLFRAQIEPVLLALRVARMVAGDRVRDVASYVASRDPNLRNDIALYDAVSVNGGNNAPVEELEEDFRKLITADRARENNQDGTLIERIVDILQLPYTGNYLTIAKLRRLRDAILIPQEKAGLEERLSLMEMQCTCGHQVTNGEMLTMSMGAEGMPTRMMCIRCRRPNLARCVTPSCEGYVYVGERFSFAKPYCEDCMEAQKTGKKKAAPPPTGDEVPDPQSFLESLAVAARRGLRNPAPRTPFRTTLIPDTIDGSDTLLGHPFSTPAPPDDGGS